MFESTRSKGKLLNILSSCVPATHRAHTSDALNMRLETITGLCVIEKFVLFTRKLTLKSPHITKHLLGKILINVRK